MCVCGVRQCPVCGVESNNATAMYSTSCIPSCARIVKELHHSDLDILYYSLTQCTLYMCTYIVKMLVVLRTLRSC